MSVVGMFLFGIGVFAICESVGADAPGAASGLRLPKKKILRIVAIEVLIGFVTVVSVALSKPVFYSPDINIPAHIIGVLLILLMILLLIERERDVEHNLLIGVFVSIGLVSVGLLFWVVEATRGLMLSPFTEFYAAILVSVLLLSSERRSLTVTIATTVLSALMKHLHVGATHDHEAVMIPGTWHLWHGMTFTGVLFGLFLIDSYRDRMLHRQLLDRGDHV